MAEQTKYEKIFSDYHRGMYVVQAQEQILHTNPVIGLFPKKLTPRTLLSWKSNQSTSMQTSCLKVKDYPKVQLQENSGEN